ncbi:MAG: HAMP domain-containing sensor histidine kinase [Eubacteriales bacterium]
METKEQGSPSLTHHLVWNLFLRQMVFVTTVNFLLIFLSGGALLLWAEHSVAKVNTIILSQGMPSEREKVWLDASNFQFSLLDRPAQGSSFPTKELLSPLTRNGLRNVSAIYVVEFDGEDGSYAISVDLRDTVATIKVFFWFLIIVEMFFVCSGLFAYHRSIHHSLQPIEDLANATFRLNDSGRGKEMDALAGELAKINTLRPDSRIPLSATEKELQPLALAINSMLDRVEEAHQSQMRFVSDASHELRTPIAVIQGYSAMLDRWGKSNPETLQESIDAIRDEAKSMERLIEQLLFLARGDNQSQPIHKVPMDLSVTAAEVLREEGMLFPEHQLIPRWDGDFQLVADPALMKQLLRILMDNSLKYTAVTGRVWLSLEQNDTSMIVTVEDEGMGIPPESLPKIFQRFYRSDTSRTRQTGGTGLGLSIAHWIVTEHQGWFEVCSREEIGTRITVLLPKKEGTDP